MPQIHSENADKFSFCSFDANSVHFPRATKTESYAVQYFKSTLQRFASKTLQNVSE